VRALFDRLASELQLSTIQQPLNQAYPKLTTGINGGFILLLLYYSVLEYL